MPSLLDFDCIHIGISGGKDSTALALWVKYESGIPEDRVEYSFCDTGNEDPFTYQYLDLLREHFPISVIHPERDFWELAKHKHRFPSTKARFCTTDLKVIPTRQHVLKLMKKHDSVVVLNGVRRSEGRASNSRGAALEWELDVEGWGTWIHRPLVDWTIRQVWDMHTKYVSLDKVIALVQNDPNMADGAKGDVVQKMQNKGVPSNPLYYMGAGRVGCYPCINANKGGLRAMTKYRPERIDFIEKQELSFTDTKNGISTFFRRNAVPERWRSRAVMTKDGRVVRVPTIRDVASWALTAWGGRQYSMDLEDVRDEEPSSACDIGGMCE